MDLSLSPEQKQIRDTVAAFVDEEIVPVADEIDHEDEYPGDLIEEMADLGLLGMPFPEEYGGAGLDYHSYAIGLEEISRGSGGLGTVVAAHTSLAGNVLYEFGSEEQKRDFLTPLAEGSDVGAFALSEPGAGSDVSAMETTAERVEGDESAADGTAAEESDAEAGDGGAGDGAGDDRDGNDRDGDDRGGNDRRGDDRDGNGRDGNDRSTVEADERAADDGTGGEYVLNGGKLWISNGSVADTVIVFAKTDPEAGNGGISSFVVRPEVDEGFIVEGTEDKLGDKGCPTAELRFDELRLPADRRIGAEGEGFVQALKTLNGGRITIAARGVGIARAAFEAAREYAGEREQFGQPIGEFQSIKHKLADMDTKIRAAKLLMHDAADRKMSGESYVKEAAQAKLYASEVSREVANEGIQIHGGYGYVTDFPAERFYRDAKLNEIYEGTSEVLRNTIGDRLLD